MTEQSLRQISLQRKRRLMITVDVEAQPGRAKCDHVDRLIWGKFEEGQAGIGELMDIADRHGVKTTMFLDYCEEHLYGSAFRDVAREIHQRGHDLQLHAHLDFLSRDWWVRNKIEPQYNLNELNADQAAAAIDFLCERQMAAVNVPAIGFRGGGYRFNEHVLDALVKRHVLVDSSVNVSRTTQPVSLPISKQFIWSNGCLEVPVSCVTGYRNLARSLDFNFNASSMPTPAEMVEYLDTFYKERGDDAIAVLVMHSWSFLLLTNNKFFTASCPELVQRFSEFLDLITGRIEVVTARDIAAEFRDGELSFDATLDTRRLSDRKVLTSAVLQANASDQMPTCPICGAGKSRFTRMNGRQCPDCGSVERQRAFAVAYDNDIKSAFDIAGKSVLIISPSASELRFLEARGVAGKTSVDVRPTTKPDVVADVCAMPQFASESHDFVFASYLMPVVHDMDAALGEIARVLAPGGIFISIEIVATGRNTIEHYDTATLTGWYGKEAFEQYKVGSHRTLGEDYVKILRTYLNVSVYRAADPITGQESLTFLCRKPDEKRLDYDERPKLEELAVEIINTLAARRSGKLVCHSWTGSPFASRLKEDQRLEIIPPIISSWRSLKDPKAAAGLAQMSGCAPGSIDFVFGRDVLDYLPSMQAAIASVARVLSPGGVAVLSIKTARLKPDATPPRLGYVISGSRYNLAEGMEIASMEVGREWLSAEVATNGLSLDINVCGEGLVALVCRKPDEKRLDCDERPKLEELAAEIINNLAARRSGKLVCHSWTGSPFASRLREDQRLEIIPPIISSWRNLEDPEAVAGLAQMSGCAPGSIDFVFGRDVLDYLPSMQAAIASVARVLSPGGIAVLSIKTARLRPDATPPRLGYVISGSRYNLAEGLEIASMEVGREWLSAEVATNGVSLDINVCGEGLVALVLRKPSATTPAERICNICGFDFAALPATEVNCAGRCKSRPRTRTIPLVCELLEPDLDSFGDASERRLLAFAMTASEHEVVNRYFGDIVSVSLYGEYRRGHTTGVDARDLGRFDPASFDGAFGVLLFDYFLEHEKSLAELMRILKPGGVFFTHVASYRLSDSEEAPVNTANIQKRPGYFEYLPDDANMPSIKVGRRWLLAAFERVGFKARLAILKDPVSGDPMDWFIGVKPDAVPNAGVGCAVHIAIGSSRRERELTHTLAQDHDGPTATRTEACADDGSPLLVYDAELHNNPDVRSIRLALSGVNVPASVRGFDFAEHIIDVSRGEATDTVVLVGGNALGVSEDLGRTWRRIAVPGGDNLRLWNSFTTATGRHIVQSRGWQGPIDGTPDPERHAALFLFDKEWRFLGRTYAGLASWHGTASIGQAGPAIMFGEYFNNFERYLADFEEKQEQYMKVLKGNAIWCSLDDGETWNKTIERGPLEVRHFHTVQPDRYDTGGWWASTGDTWSETRVWRGLNNGDNWIEVTNPEPNVELPLEGVVKASCQRFTDMVIEAHRLIWGADDLLGPRNACRSSLELRRRAGSRIYCSARVNPLEPVEVGYVGQPIRKLVDVGPGWIVITEAKTREFGFRPQVFFLGKRKLDLTYLFDADNITNASSGFSYSRGSNRARQGVFFTFKHMLDAVPTTTRCLRWEVAFG